MISVKDTQKYCKIIGISFLIILIIFCLFCVILNRQDLSSLEIKNSNRRKIMDKYSDENMKSINNNSFIHRQNNKLKKYRKSFKTKNLFDVSNLQNDIKKYKKKKLNKKLANK
jgi:hypothetical protein